MLETFQPKTSATNIILESVVCRIAIAATRRGTLPVSLGLQSSTPLQAPMLNEAMYAIHVVKQDISREVVQWKGIT